METVINGITYGDIPVKQVIKGVKEADLTTLVVMGYTKDGEEYFASSCADGGDILWLLERMKLQLLTVQLPEK